MSSAAADDSITGEGLTRRPATTPWRCSSSARFLFRVTRQNCAVRYPQGPPHTDHTVWARPADHLPPPGQPGYGPPRGQPHTEGATPSRIGLRGPLSIVVIAVIVASLVAGGLLAAEL